MDGVAFPIRAQILADSYVTKRLHSTREEAEKQLMPILEEMAQQTEPPQCSNQASSFVNIFNTLGNIISVIPTAESEALVTKIIQ